MGIDGKDRWETGMTTDRRMTRTDWRTMIYRREKDEEKRDNEERTDGEIDGVTIDQDKLGTTKETGRNTKRELNHTDMQQRKKIDKTGGKKADRKKKTLKF
jgi:hypothetical protein